MLLADKPSEVNTWSKRNIYIRVSHGERSAPVKIRMYYD